MRDSTHSVGLSNERISRLEIAESCALLRLELNYVVVLSRIELRSYSQILEWLIAQQCCDLSWRPALRESLP